MSALLTLAFGTLPDSLPAGHGTFLDSFSHSGLTVFLKVRCGLSAPVSGKAGIATMLGHQNLTIWAPEEEERVVGVPEIQDIGSKALLVLSISLWLQKWQQI